MKRSDYVIAALRLRILHASLELMLSRARAAAHANMRQVAPGVWVHNRYASLRECLADIPGLTT